MTNEGVQIKVSYGYINQLPWFALILTNLFIIYVQSAQCNTVVYPTHQYTNIYIQLQVLSRMRAQSLFQAEFWQAIGWKSWRGAQSKRKL